MCGDPNMSYSWGKSRSHLGALTVSESCALHHVSRTWSGTQALPRTAIHAENEQKMKARRFLTKFCAALCK
jgi:hypothetical protein